MHIREDGREKLGINPPWCQAGGESGLGEDAER